MLSPVGDRTVILGDTDLDRTPGKEERRRPSREQVAALRAVPEVGNGKKVTGPVDADDMASAEGLIVTEGFQPEEARSSSARGYPSLHLFPPAVIIPGDDILNSLE